MCRLQQEQTKAYRAMKVPRKSIDRYLVKIDFSNRRMTESSTSDGVVMKQSANSQSNKPPDGQVIILLAVRNKEANLSRDRISLKQKANAQR
ncbi:hypothetical protein S83_020148 [Arachis hypogaea]